MNKELSDFARQKLKDGLAQCTDEQVYMFKRMYSHKNLELPINDVVASMPDEKLDWAMQQVSRTLEKQTQSRG